jgi:hypothetical protein
MKIQFLDKTPKIAALVLPVKMASKEVETLTLLLASAIRMTRGYEGMLIQKTTHPIFKVETERIDHYPLVISEDHESEPAIPLLEDASDLLLMWSLQSKANVKWVYDYLQAIIKAHDIKPSKATVKTLEAYAITEFGGDLKIKTPPPYLGLPKGSIVPNVEESYRSALHKVAGVKFLGNDTPAWWSQQLSDKLTAKPTN